MRKLLIDFVPGLIGGVVGGIAGYFLVYWISQQGFYAPVLPGALAGLGCGLASRTDSLPRGIACAVLAVIVGLITEWLVFYRPVETTFANFQGFLTQFPKEPMVTKLLLGLGVFLGFWWGRECTLRSRLNRPQAKTTAE
jgi:fructose-specific phosphotransferase system IIC component